MKPHQLAQLVNDVTAAASRDIKAQSLRCVVSHAALTATASMLYHKRGPVPMDHPKLSCAHVARLIHDVSRSVEARYKTHDARVTIAKSVLLSLGRQGLLAPASMCALADERRDDGSRCNACQTNSDASTILGIFTEKDGNGHSPP